MNAKLPKSAETVTLADMKVGTSGYTVPWAMYADQERKLWLDPHFTFQEQPGGTVQMHVARTDEGFRVWYVGGETYRVGAGRSAPDEDGLPVARLIGAPEDDDQADNENA